MPAKRKLGNIIMIGIAKQVFRHGLNCGIRTMEGIPVISQVEAVKGEILGKFPRHGTPVS
jgi:hypothetical protein